MQNNTDKLRKLISVLRGPRGCVWDRRQTTRSLAPLAIEESYELVDAVERGGRSAFKEELGDLLFLILSIAAAAEKRGDFSYRAVVKETAEKYIHRHPHVFRGERKMTPKEILAQWEKAKSEKSGKNPIDSVPEYLPALYQAKRLYDKAARLGIGKNASTSKRQKPKIIGRRLLELACRAAQHGIDPEAALRGEIRTYRRKLKKNHARLGS